MGERTDEVRRQQEYVDPAAPDAARIGEPETVAVYRDQPDTGSSAGSSSADIQSDIERTRADMSETIDAIQERLNPRNLAEQAKDAAYDATIGRAQHTAKGAGSSMWETIKQNPIPAAIAGVSLGYLFSKRSSSSSGSAQRYRTYNEQRYETYREPRYQTYEQGESTSDYARERAGQAGNQARETAEQYGNQARETAEQYGRQAQQQAQEATDWFQRTLQDNPLAIGAVAVALGAAFGLAVPETQKEHELMGETRDQMLQQAKSRAQDTMQRAQHVAEEAQGAARQEAKEQGLSS